MASPTLSAVIVAYNSAADLRHSLPPLVAQLELEDELIVVDNGSADDLADALAEVAPDARLLPAPGNVGFAAGANLGAGQARGELLVLLNPDAIVQPGWAEAIRRPWGGDWAGWMGLVTMAQGEEINTSGGVLHFTGLGWAGQAGAPFPAGPAAPAEVGFLSGACLAIPAELWRNLGGFPEDFFMYCEDVDLSLRLRLHGGRLGVIPDALADHDYEFHKGQRKWRMLERNRWATIVRTYPGPLLALVLPALLAAELAIWATALRGGWARMKALATLDFLAALPRLLRQRREIQAARTVSAAEFARTLTATLDSPYLGGAARHPLLARLLDGYWNAVRALL